MTFFKKMTLLFVAQMQFSGSDKHKLKVKGWKIMF
jgi:hypothetical protein